jgi:hypothetical protein
MNPVKEMIRRPATYLLLAALGLAGPAAAQTPLTLTEAIARARAQNPNFLWFTLFVGLNLFQSAFTQWCPMMAILRKAGIRG